MQGVEILNKTEITTKPIWAWILLGLCVVAGVIAYWVYDNTISNLKEFISGMLVIIFVVIGVVVLVYSEPTGRYTYEAIIDKNVSINEVYEHYKVIEQNGKKWVLEDKESD